MVVATGLASLDQQDHVIYPVEHDAIILSEVMDVLQVTGYRSLAQLSCEVKNGVVHLHGELPSYFLKQVAQETVRQVKGIRGVKNFAVVR
jgi:osmotically-inducible protein OsmY